MSYILCLHRWVGQQALYAEYLKESNFKLRVLCTEESIDSLPRACCLSIEAFPSLDNVEQVLSIAERLTSEHGMPELIVALNEADLLTAALLRERWQIKGDHSERTEQFRDKLKMLDVAKMQSAIKVLPAERPENVESIVASSGFPMILKPRFGTASKGVKRITSLEQFDQEAPFHEPMMVQEFCSAPLLHVDGWWDGYELVVATVSRYSNTCAEFDENSPLGSVELNHGDEEQRILDRVKVLVSAFSPKEDLVFHLELFEDGEELVFLEIAARVGGAEIPFMWREIRNIDLLGIAWELQTGLSTVYRDRARQLSSGSRPIQVDRGAWIIAQRHGASKDDLKTLYWAQGEDKEFYASGVYEGAKTRLRFKSNHQELLLTDVQKVFLQLSEA